MGEGGLLAILGHDGRYLPRCGRCGARAAYRDARPERRFRHVPLWGMAVPLAYAPGHVRYPPCGAHVEFMSRVLGKHRRTRTIAVTLASWARILPWRQVAALFHVAWGTVAHAVEEAMAYGLAHQALSEVTHISPRCSDAIRVTSCTTSHRPSITAPSNEGLNNKARIISHKAYGFRSPARCIRNLYHCMADLPLSKTVHTFV